MYVLLLISSGDCLEAHSVSCRSDDAAVLEAFKRFELIRSIGWEHPSVDLYCGDRRICNIGEVL